MRFRAASLTMRFFGVAAPALSALSADIHLGGLPRRLPLLPTTSRWTTKIASSINSRSARRSASRWKVHEDPTQYHIPSPRIDGRKGRLRSVKRHDGGFTTAPLTCSAESSAEITTAAVD